MQIDTTHGPGGSRMRLTVAVIAAVALTTGATAALAANPRENWRMGGQNTANTRNSSNEHEIKVSNVGSLRVKWNVTTAGDVSATPAVDDDRVYFPDSAGNLYAVNRDTGAVLWTSSISGATGIAGDYARATPAIAGKTLVIGTQSGKFETPSTPAALAGGYVLGFDIATGALKWKTKVDNHFSAIVTQSAVIQGSNAYVGVAGNEEAYVNKTFNGGQPYTCCTFRGSILKLNTNTGAISWKTYTVPDIAGYSGGAVWGSTPALDTATGSLYITTGNNYSMPVPVLECVQSAVGDSAKHACVSPDDHFDSIVSLNSDTGAIKWAYNSLASDAWNVDCGIPGFPLDLSNNNCPSPATGPDYDFAQGPMLFTGGGRVLVGAGEKSGDFVTLDRATGAVVWRNHVGPGGLTGGLQWGSATDGKQIYVAQDNSATLTVGYWAALDPATGVTNWTSTEPSTGYPFGPKEPYGYSIEGPVSVANGVMYGCSLSPNGPNMFALDATTGQVKWSFASGASCLGGAAIADGNIYWGTGYRAFAPLTTGVAPGQPGLYAFSLDDNGNH